MSLLQQSEVELLQSKTVFVVDDEELMRGVFEKFLAKMLERGLIAGFQVFESGAALLQHIRQLETTLGVIVVSDLNMSAMDGFDVLEGVWVVNPTIPALVATATTILDTPGDDLGEVRNSWQHRFPDLPADEFVFNKLKVVGSLLQSLARARSAAPNP